MSKGLPVEGVAKHLVVMIAVAAVLGVLVAGLAVPFAGVLGVGANQAAKSMKKLPTSFDTGDLEQTTKILDANGNLITTLYDQNRVYKPLSQISRKMTSAIVSIEDYRFYQHGALDLKGTLRALITNKADGGVVQGGSSITQQLVKQTLLSQAKTAKQRKAATADTVARKIKELRYAIALEQNHSKDWILEKYLNTAYFGDSAYGVQAAAKHYFDVNANQLTWPEAAMIAGMVKNPTGYNPANHPDAAKARRNTVLERMAQLHVITDAQATKYEKESLQLHLQPSQNGCVNSTAPFFCDYVVRYLEQDPSLGKTAADRKQLLLSGGLTIKTTLKPDYQTAADKSVAAHVFPNDPAIGAIAEVQPGTGDVLALAQSRPMGNAKGKGQTYINYTIPQDLGGSAGFQAGSTFKLFVLSAAIEDHIPASTTFTSPSPLTVDPGTYANCPDDSSFIGGPPWTVHNETGVGNFNMYTGMQLSINTFFIQLEQLTGVCKPYALAQSMGVQLTDPDGDKSTGNGAERIPSFTLGVPGVSPLEMAGAYATVANRGKHCDAKPVTEIDDANGNPIKTYADQCQQVMPTWAADQVNDILRGVMEPGGFGYSLGNIRLRTKSGKVIPSAGKTGTTNGDKAVWFDGYTPQVAAAAMIAGANGVGQPQSLDNKTVGGHFTGYSASGSGFAGPVWRDAIEPVEDTLQPVDFHPLDKAALVGEEAEVPTVTGLTVAEAQDKLMAAGFAGAAGTLAADSIVHYQSLNGTQPEGSVVRFYTGSSGSPKHGKSKKKSKKSTGRAITPPAATPGGFTFHGVSH